MYNDSQLLEIDAKACIVEVCLFGRIVAAQWRQAEIRAKVFYLGTGSSKITIEIYAGIWAITMLLAVS